MRLLLCILLTVPILLIVSMVWSSILGSICITTCFWLLFSVVRNSGGFLGLMYRVFCSCNAVSPTLGIISLTCFLPFCCWHNNPSIPLTVTGSVVSVGSRGGRYIAWVLWSSSSFFLNCFDAFFSLTVSILHALVLLMSVNTLLIC